MLGELRCPEYNINKISRKRDFSVYKYSHREELGLAEIVGIVAGFLTTGAFLPQVFKTVNTRSTDDLSWIWLVMMIGGVFLWFVYGLYISSISLIVSNAITLVSVVTLFCVKYKNYHKVKKK